MDAGNLGPISAPRLIPQPGAGGRREEVGGFAGLLAEAVGRVGELQGEADGELRRLLAGEPVELHRVLLAAEEAGLASQLLMSVRNKVVDAYQEVMRMQV
jgi:flagellar hook-basal body complex protein FliE